MRKRCAAAVILAAVSVSPLAPAFSAFAQSDAEANFQKGKQAMAKGDFENARRAFIQASQTDPNNPEVFLNLGKADYELGYVDDAIAAWKSTISLAPNEPTAKQMLKVLLGQARSAETTLTLIEALLVNGFNERAGEAASRLLGDQSLTDRQRSRALLLRAESLLNTGSNAQAAAIVEEARLNHPAQQESQQADLLLARIQLVTAGPLQLEAVRRLHELAEAPDPGSAGITARYHLLVFAIDQAPDAANVDALAKWVAGHGDHPDARSARQKVITAYLHLTDLAGVANADSSLAASANTVLSGSDQSAIRVADELSEQIASAAESSALVGQIITHLQNHYAIHGANMAAAAGAEQLLAIKSLLPQSRFAVMRALGSFQFALAVEEVAALAHLGHLNPVPELPQHVAEALKVYTRVNQEFPAFPLWAEQAKLAAAVKAIGDEMPWPATVTELKPAYRWAVRIALPVLPSRSAAAMAEATVTINDIIEQVAASGPDGLRIAMDIQGQLANAAPTDLPDWILMSWRQVSLLDRLAGEAFDRNIAAAESEKNAKPSAYQESLLATEARIVARDVRQAPQAIERLQAHLTRWIAAGQFDVAESLYNRLAAVLPEPQRRRAELAIVQLWITHAEAGQRKLAAAGQAEPLKLDPDYVRAARRLYEMQQGVSRRDSFLFEIQTAFERIVNHYRAINQFELAEQVISIRSNVAVPTADTFAQYLFAVTHDEAARHTLDKTLKQYKPIEGLTVTEAVESVIAEYEKFITDHPTDPLAHSSAQAILALAQLYQDDGAYDVAIKLYGELATFAAQNKELSVSLPNQSSFADGALLAVAGALDIKARQMFAKANIGQKQLTPPAKISDEFAAAIKSYQEFITSRPDSSLVGLAIQRIGAIALDYARSDAWDIADGVYATLLAPQIKIREPARIEFSRGMCQVGKVMPEHAKEVLTALLSSASSSNEESLARLKDQDKAIKDADRLSVGASKLELKYVAGATVFSNGSLDIASEKAVETPALREPSKAKASEQEATALTRKAARNTVALDSVAASDQFGRADTEALAAISRQEARRAQQVAALRDFSKSPAAGAAAGKLSSATQPGQSQNTFQFDSGSMLSESELARQQTALNAAYSIFQSIKAQHADTPTAEQSRAEIMVMAGYWRGINQPQRAATLLQEYLKDNAKDGQLPQLRLAIAQDDLTYAAEPLHKPLTSQQRLAEVAHRFEAGRDGLTRVISEFADEKSLVQQAQWEVATSFLSQARVVDGFSPVLARGQYVRAATELQKVAERYADHPQMANVPQMLCEIAGELNQRGYYEEAISVWTNLGINHTTSPLAAQAQVVIAQTFQTQLGRPLRAAEVYLEINFARGGGDIEMQNSVFNIGSQLTAQKRWVEALHVLEIFVYSFPRHANAGQALAMIGQIHQANESWQDAIAAYQRVIEEYPASGQSLLEARWAIAECIINLSQWKQAIEAYQSFVASFPKDSRIAEANRRIGILKDLNNFQMLVNENGSKAFDAQFQIATIVEKQLNLLPKAVVEYQKVATHYPNSHLAADALFAIGTIQRERGDINQARIAWLDTAHKYPDSPLADSALYQVGKSYEDEAQRLAGLTLETSVGGNMTIAQNRAYLFANSQAMAQKEDNAKRLSKARSNGRDEAELQIAANAFNNYAGNTVITGTAVTLANNDVEVLTASQLADRQDKINSALRKAVRIYDEAAKVAGGDKAGEALLRMAVIYNDRLGDSGAAMKTWLEIVRQFSGTSVAEEASWQIAVHYEKAGQFAEAVEAYKSFLRNYRRSPKAADAQFFIAENYEHLNQWVGAMDQYTNYLNNFPDGPLAQKAREQIAFIKTYRL